MIEEIELSEIKTGYQFLQKPKPEIKDYSSWLGPFIIFFINIWNKIYKRELCPYSHSFTAIWDNGVLMAYEAVSPVYRKITFEEKLREVSPDRLLVLVPQFNFDENILTKEAEEMIGKPYDFLDVLISEQISQLTDGRVWIGSRNENTVYCNKACLYLAYKSTNDKLFTDYYLETANDQLKSKLYIHKKLKV